VDTERGQGVAIIQRVGVVASFLKIGFCEGVFVDDQSAATFQIGNVGFEGCRINGNQSIDLVARSENIQT
jgi:hypothetical protein